MNTIAESVVAHRGWRALMTDKTAETLRTELEHRALRQSKPCDTCGALKGDPCHSRFGRIVFTYHVARVIATEEV